MNQCDGCNRGLPVVNGNHYLTGIGSYPGEVMGCTAARYFFEDIERMYEQSIDDMLAESSSLPQCLMDESMDEELGT